MHAVAWLPSTVDVLARLTCMVYTAPTTRTSCCACAGTAGGGGGGAGRPTKSGSL